MTGPHRFGFITFAGPPNAGKSTLVNNLTGHKVSIVSRRPQTTRHRVLGIRSLPEAQLVFVDTPGIHQDEGRNLNRVINRTAINSLSDVDLIVFMIDHRGWNNSLLNTLNKVKSRDVPVILVINKIDTLKDKSRLLPLIQESSRHHDFAEIIPLSALKLDDPDGFMAILIKHLPEGPPGFPEDQVSDRGSRFHASEIVREQIFGLLGEELPYDSAVEVTRFDSDDADRWEIDMTIWVERPGQKSIVVGKGGQVLKNIGQRARLTMEREFDVRVQLNLWVKQRKGWADNMSMLKSLGYSEE